MLGYYSARTIGILFGEQQLEKFQKTFSVACSIVFIFSTSVALGILRFDQHYSNPIHLLLRHTVAISLILLACFAILCTLVYVRRSKATIYSVSPLLLTPIAFAIYSLDLVNYNTDISSSFTLIYAICRLLNCVLLAYSLSVIRRNTRCVALVLTVELILAIILLTLHNKSMIYEISLIIWASMIQFSISLVVGASHQNRKEKPIDSKFVTNSEEYGSSCEIVKIRAWLPNNEDTCSHIVLPVIGRYSFAYSLRRRDFLVGHITFETNSFYASIYPDKNSWLAEEKRPTSKTIGSSHRMFYPGVWQSLDYDIQQRGSAYNVCVVDAFDPDHLISVWHTLKKDSSYSLYSRNCAIVTVRLFEECIRDSLSEIPFTIGILRTYLSSYFWSAIIAKQRSELFTWSPGLAYDYIRSLSLLIARLTK